MAAGPRKFSDKIALLNQKQAEGNAAFNSIMNQVQSIVQSNTRTSGSQLDILENLNDPLSSHSALDETLSITYVSEGSLDQQNLLSSQFQSHTGKNQILLIKNNEQHIQQFNTFLQLPNQTDSFRRAHSDSSLNHSVTSSSNGAFTNDLMNNNIGNHIGLNVQQSQTSLNQTYNLQTQPQHHSQNIQQQQEPHHYQFQQFQSSNINQPEIYQLQQQQQQQHFQHQTTVSTHAFTNQSNFIQGQPSEYNVMPFRNLSLPITTTLAPASSASNNTNTNDKVNNKKAALCSPTSANGATIPLVSPSIISPTTSSHLIKANSNSNLNMNASSPTNLSPTLINNPQLVQSKFISNKDSQLMNSNSNGSLNNSNGNNSNNFAPFYSQQLNTTSPIQSPSNSQFNYTPVMNVPAQQHYQVQQTIPEQLISPNGNNNYLMPNFSNTSGGSLPDLVSFQLQNNQSQQNDQMQEYNKRQQQQQHMISQTNNNHHQQQQQFELASSQMLQPNFQQHNHIGPVKNSSVSPTRTSRYSPTNSNSNLNSFANRRQSPHQISSGAKPLAYNVSLSPQSTPTSPLHPSMQSLPSLEFTVNSNQLNNYSVGNHINGVGLNVNPGILNGVIYRTNSSTNCSNGISSESLPPSPQSQQQSCINSPQGSPGPLSISPQDLNPFTSNNYDIMQKKFDSINLETSNPSYNNFSASGSYIHMSSQNNSNVLSPTSQNSITSQNVSILNRPSHMHSRTNDSSICNSNIIKSNNNNSSCSNNTNNNNNDLIQNGINHESSINNTTSNINNSNNNNNNNNQISNSNITNNNLNNINANILVNNINGNNNTVGNGKHIIEIDINKNNNNSTHNSNNNITNNDNIDDNSLNDINSNNYDENLQKQTLMNRTHKNSIPNIIFTSFHDSIDERNDLKDVNSGLIYNDEMLVKTENFDLENYQMYPYQASMCDQ